MEFVSWIVMASSYQLESHKQQEEQEWIDSRIHSITTSNAKVRYSKERGSHIDQSWNTKLNASASCKMLCH